MAFVRRSQSITNKLGTSEFPFEAGRYILYATMACPWANGALLSAQFHKLISEGYIRVVIAHPSWQFTDPEKDKKELEKMGMAKIPFISAGLGPTHAHSGWPLAQAGEKILPLSKIFNAADFGLELPGSAEDISMGKVKVPQDILDKHGIVSSRNTPDCSKNKARNLRQLYDMTGGELYSGFTPSTPMLLDEKTNKIVNNESADIFKMLNEWGMKNHADGPDMYPEKLRDQIEEMNKWIYVINNGVYRCGFCSDQVAYDQASADLAGRMAELEKHLEGRTFLVGDTLTMSDIRLFMTLIRMDECYVTYFKCYFASIFWPKHKNILRYAAHLWNNFSAIRDNVSMDDICAHYYTSHMKRNMYGIIPKKVGVIERLEAMK